MAKSSASGLRPWGVVGRFRRGLGELGLIVTITLFYYATRGLAIGQEQTALANARALIDLQRTLNFFVEPAFNQWVVAHPAAVNFLNWVYTYLHMPVLIAFALWVYAFRQPQYAVIRNAFLVSAVSGLIIYSFFPVAPPRMLPEYGFTDTLTSYSNVHFDTGPVKLFYNPYAAMPSLHFGWSLLVGVGLCWLGRHWLPRALGVLLPTLMLLSIIGTGNHFIVDAVGGAFVLGLGCLVGFWTRLVEFLQARGVGQQSPVGSR